jgi:hypothetical protein
MVGTIGLSNRMTMARAFIFIGIDISGVAHEVLIAKPDVERGDNLPRDGFGDEGI